MIPSLEYLERCAADTGFQVASLEKVARLGEFAADAARHAFLGSALALKGGTALNLCFGAPRRLSVDLDFNYVAHIAREQMLEDRDRVEATVSEIAQRHGYRIQRSVDAFAGRKLFLRYRSVLGHDDRIEVDLNYLFRVPIGETQRLSLWQPGDLDRPEVRVVSVTELVIGKLLAFLDRAAARDVWDAAYLPLPALEATRTSTFRRWFVALSAVLPHPLLSYRRARLDRLITDRAVAEHLAPLLVRGVPPSARDLVERGWATVEPLLALEADEVAYVVAIDRGELRPQLLFPDNTDEAARIGAHPALLWKIEKVHAGDIRRRDQRRGPKPRGHPKGN
jgi:predicted nucleotidyltransferase component of viral defense system